MDVAMTASPAPMKPSACVACVAFVAKVYPRTFWGPHRRTTDPEFSSTNSDQPCIPCLSTDISPVRIGASACRGARQSALALSCGRRNEGSIIQHSSVESAFSLCTCV